jgi:hypothetical protein
MKFRELLDRVFRPTRSPVPAVPPTRPDTFDRERAAAWLEASDDGRLNPPFDAHDSTAWDTYWRNHLAVGPMEQAFADMMSSDSGLPGWFKRRGVRTVLCAGNGLSTESLALALLGFHVTSLDISATACEALEQTLRQVRGLAEIPGVSIEDRSIHFGHAGPIDPQLCPAMHRSPNLAPQAGGSLTLIVGDLTDADVCPGLFDAVIERRTVQLFPDGDRVHAYERLTGRLARRGVFVSHEHQGGWKPGASRTHHAESWLTSHGFVLHRAAQPEQSVAADRVALLMFSTG